MLRGVCKLMSVGWEKCVYLRRVSSVYLLCILYTVDRGSTRPTQFIIKYVKRDASSHTYHTFGAPYAHTVPCRMCSIARAASTCTSGPDHDTRCDAHVAGRPAIEGQSPVHRHQTSSLRAGPNDMRRSAPDITRTPSAPLQEKRAARDRALPPRLGDQQLGRARQRFSVILGAGHAVHRALLSTRATAHQKAGGRQRVRWQGRARVEALT